MAEVIGHFEQAVLVALVRLGSDAYGRAILNEVQKRLEREVSAGAVYATLERLEAKGFALSRLAPVPFALVCLLGCGLWCAR